MADLFEPDGPQVFSLPDADLRLFEAADIGAVDAGSSKHQPQQTLLYQLVNAVRK